MKKLIYLLFISFALPATEMALAETAYIVDQLLVGLHQEKNTDSPIIKVLSTGTEVEIINREGDFAEIRELTEDKIGWVDASYLMLDQPAKLQLVKLQEKIKDLEEMDGVQATLAIQAENEEKATELNKQIDDLKQNLSSEKLKAGELEATISQQEKKLAQIEASGSEHLITDLEKKNSELQNQLNAVNQRKSGQVSWSGNQIPFLQQLDLFKEKIVLITLAVLTLVGFFFGRRWEDKKSRKRHGGFRV